MFRRQKLFSDVTRSGHSDVKPDSRRTPVQGQPELLRNKLQDSIDNLESFSKRKTQDGHLPRVCEAPNLSAGIQKQDEVILLKADMKPRAFLASHDSSLTASDPLSTPHPIFLCNRYPTRGCTSESLLSSHVFDKNGTNIYVASYSLGFTKLVPETADGSVLLYCKCSCLFFRL